MVLETSQCAQHIRKDTSKGGSTELPAEDPNSRMVKGGSVHQRKDQEVTVGETEEDAHPDFSKCSDWPARATRASCHTPEGPRGDGRRAERSGTAPPEGGCVLVPEGGQDVRRRRPCRKVLQEQGQPVVSCIDEACDGGARAVLGIMSRTIS